MDAVAPDGDCHVYVATLRLKYESPDIVVQMIATGLAFGVLVDAVIVRTLLVPALVAIMGRWNWWMPNGLARLLRLPPATADQAGSS